VDPYEIEDTSDWLGCPTQLETVKHYADLLENEVLELNLQLRRARENIHGLVEMHAQAVAEREEAQRLLRERAGELAAVRKELYHMEVAARGAKREVERLRGILDSLTPQPKTII